MTYILFDDVPSVRILYQAYVYEIFSVIDAGIIIYPARAEHIYWLCARNGQLL